MKTALRKTEIFNFERQNNGKILRIKSNKLMGYEIYDISSDGKQILSKKGWM